MSAVPLVRPFHRDDRDQLTALVNAHASAVVPGAAVSVNTVLSSLERSPEEYITDPWVAERVTLVAEDRRRITAAAHLLRYRDDAEVGEEYRGTGHVSWFVHVPDDGSPESGDGTEPDAAGLLMSACLARLARWQVRARFADGALPVPGVYGVPAQWPHVRALLERSGFRHGGAVEIVLLARVADLPDPGPAPLPGVTVRRTLGSLGTRFTARRDGEWLGAVEIDTTLDRPERLSRAGGTADVCDLELAGDAPPDLLARLLGEARTWLALCGADRLLAYTGDGPEDAEEYAGLTAHGFRELTRTARGWEHRAG
jgi:hypothetical protein